MFQQFFNPNDVVVDKIRLSGTLYRPISSKELRAFQFNIVEHSGEKSYYFVLTHDITIYVYPHHKFVCIEFCLGRLLYQSNYYRLAELKWELSLMLAKEIYIQKFPLTKRAERIENFGIARIDMTANMVVEQCGKQNY